MVNSFQLTTPVAFLVFNRPDTTQRVFEEIRRARPPKLLVVADGPRADRLGETEKCKAVRAIIDTVDWPCKVLKNYSDVNLGCKMRVSSGIDWVFEQVEESIILEDDCLPHPTFFRFCEEMLQTYKNNSQVAMVAGTNFSKQPKQTKESYFFSSLVQIWGWASWRRAWKMYDSDMVTWPSFVKNGEFNKLGLNSKIIKYVKPTYQAVANNEIDTWDYQWSFSVLSNSMLVVVPTNNVIQNIGFGNDATHTLDSSIPHAQLTLCQMHFPLVHPNLVLASLEYDLSKIPQNTSGVLSNFIQRIKRFVKYAT